MLGIYWHSFHILTALMDVRVVLYIACPQFQFPKKKGLPMVTTKQAWIGFVVLLLVMLLVVVAMVYWQHVTHVSYLPVLADDITHGC